MFESLSTVTAQLNDTMQGFYWIMLPPFTAFMIVLEFLSLSKDGPGVVDVIRRVAISIILLVSLEPSLRVISMVGDSLVDEIEQIATIGDLAIHLGKTYKNGEISWFRFREAIIFILTMLSYIIAYIGIFVAKTVGQYVWSVLHICSPLMILMYVSKRTSFVTASLYKGLINVIIWKVLWAILAVMLLKTTIEFGEIDNFLATVTMNICIGASMLFIPFTAKSLIGDGLTSAASALSAAPTYAVGRSVVRFAKTRSRRAAMAPLKFIRNRFKGKKKKTKPPKTARAVKQLSYTPIKQLPYFPKKRASQKGGNKDE